MAEQKFLSKYKEYLMYEGKYNISDDYIAWRFKFPNMFGVSIHQVPQGDYHEPLYELAIIKWQSDVKGKGRKKEIQWMYRLFSRNSRYVFDDYVVWYYITEDEIVSIMEQIFVSSVYGLKVSSGSISVDETEDENEQ